MPTSRTAQQVFTLAVYTRLRVRTNPLQGASSLGRCSLRPGEEQENRIMAKRLASLMVLAVAAWCLLGVQGAEEGKRKGIVLETGKIEESEAKSKLDEPNYGYVGQLGSFVATKESTALALIVVHSYPDTSTVAMGRSKLTYEGSKRLGNVDGWVFKTEWDGKAYPSKIFLSAERVYFGGGVNAYIAADYRDKTGWVWKLHPLRRMNMVKATEGGKD
jgi:hypothetical protein